MEKKNTKGITLIALIITIIVLLILAGVTIAALTGENGVLTKSNTAKEETEEKNAEEKLQLVLGELVTDKLTDNTYNETDYINKKLTDNEMTPIGNNIVYVDGWQFEIDRSKPKIVQGLGRGELEEQIKIVANSTVTSDYVSGTVIIEIIYEGEIETIKLNGEEITVPQKQNGKYAVEQQITNNGNYSVIAKDKNGKFNIASTQVTDITEDMEIWNKEDMIAFRKKVNDEGRTFETKKAIVMADINLKGSDTDQWVPINEFKGTFEGNYHTINDLYVKSNSYQNLGFFTTISEKTTIQNVILDNVTIENTYESGTIQSYAGAIAGISYGTINNCGVNGGNIIAKKTVNGDDNYVRVGGILGRGINNKISNCYNKANVKGEMTNVLGNNTIVGGIVGTFSGGTLSNCYNQGKVDAIGYAIFTGGIASDISSKSSNETEVKNCYNVGEIGKNNSGNIIYSAGLITRNGFSAINYVATVTNCYCTTDTEYSFYYWNGSTPNATSIQGRIEANILKGYANNLGSAFESDTTGINNGYPILKWQLEK